MTLPAKGSSARTGHGGRARSRRMVLPTTANVEQVFFTDPQDQYVPSNAPR